MTLQNVGELLSAIDGFSDKVAYRSFPAEEHVPVPFLVYYEVGTDNFAADDAVYYSPVEVQIELYTAVKNIEIESRIEKAFSLAGLFWNRYETYLDSQHCFETVYNITI